MPRYDVYWTEEKKKLFGTDVINCSISLHEDRIEHVLERVLEIIGNKSARIRNIYKHKENYEKFKRKINEELKN